MIRLLIITTGINVGVCLCLALCALWYRHDLTIAEGVCFGLLSTAVLDCYFALIIGCALLQSTLSLRAATTVKPATKLKTPRFN